MIVHTLLLLDTTYVVETRSRASQQVSLPQNGTVGHSLKLGHLFPKDHRFVFFAAWNGQGLNVRG